MFNYYSHINCPQCTWQPRAKDRWKCQNCGHAWNVFDTHGKCPRCAFNHKETTCLKCKDSNAHADWYANWRDIDKEMCLTERLF